MSGSLLNPWPMTRFAATAAALFGIEKPLDAEPAIGWVEDSMRAYVPGPFDRLFIYNADCVGMWAYRKYPEMFEPVIGRTMLAVPMCSVMPAVTPVNFATMYTGAAPEVHGIRTYVKPVVRTDTLFDAAVRAGKRTALVSLYEVGSMTRIFRDRPLDYFVANSDCESEEITHRLIHEDRHDVISTYVMDYDYIQHRRGPEDPESLAALRSHMDRFARLIDHIRCAWSAHNTLFVFTSDHGNHAVDLPDKKGDHGDDIPEDRNVLHFWGCAAERPHDLSAFR